MKCQVSDGKCEKSGKYTCKVCGEGNYSMWYVMSGFIIKDIQENEQEMGGIDGW